MDYIIAGIFLIIALYLITQPLFNPKRWGETETPDGAARRGDRHATLQAKKRLLDENITDLEFEYRMGKLSKEDFDQLQAGCASEASNLNQALAEFRTDKKMDEQIEQDIRKRRKLG
jgi:hypothetical protein